MGNETLVLGSGAVLPTAPRGRTVKLQESPAPKAQLPRELGSAPPRPPENPEPALRRAPRHGDDLARRIVQRRPQTPTPEPALPLQSRRPLLLGIAAALALAALAAAALFLTRVRVSGVVTLDSTGHQLLMLDCPRCAEGSAVAVQGVAGKLAAGKVTLRLEPELEPGHQELTVEVGRPPHEYAVTVPVMARFTPDIAPLSIRSRGYPCAWRRCPRPPSF